VSLLQTTLDQLDEDGAKLQSRRTAIPSYVPHTAPSAAKVSAASDTAASTVEQIQGSATSARQTAQTLFGAAERQGKRARATCLNAARAAS